MKFLRIQLLLLLPVVALAESSKIDDAMHELSRKPSAYQKSLQSKNRVLYSEYGIALYKPNFVLPIFKSNNIIQRRQDCETPGIDNPRKIEFNAQLSFYLRVLKDFYQDTSLYFGYTQKMFWQLYSKSPYFRELNYEPELFIQKPLRKNIYLLAGINHESNGRGGFNERSWNRAILDLNLSYQNLFMSIKSWLLIFKKQSSQLHNPDIQKFMGNTSLLLSYKYNRLTVSLMTRNNIQSGFKRGSQTITLSYHIHRKYRLYFRLFHGYGLNLIEYNHKNTSYGLGIVLNDWL